MQVLKRTARGFTLIELLVVITIITLLSTVVLASVNSARNKGIDASIRAELENMQSQAEVFYSMNGQYATTTDNNCTIGLFADSKVAAAISDIKTKNAATVACGATSGPSGGYAIQAKLVADSFRYCVDYTGTRSTSTATMSGGAIVCP